jgi:choline dehydrogenase-like flavoprotein
MGRGSIYKPEDFRTEIDGFYDVIVVGSGAGGAVISYVLAKGGKRVAILEEGRHFTLKDYRDDYFFAIKRIYRDVGSTIALSLPGKPPIAVPLGRCVGGTTVINSGTCFRIPERVIDKWNSEEGLEIDKYQLEKFYDEIEKRISVQPVSEEVLGENARVVRKGAQALGIKSHPLKRNVKGCEGCGRCAFGCPKDAKQAMHITYIPDAIEAGADLFTGTRAERIIFKEERAMGIEGTMLDEDGHPLHKCFFYGRIIVISCGAIYTPVLFIRSGIKSKSGLIGKSLKIHPAIRVAAEFEREINGWIGVPQGLFIDEFLENEGIIFEGAFVPPDMFSISLPYIGLKHKALMERYRYMSTFGAMVSETSSGMVRARGYRALIFYHLNTFDTMRLKRAVEILAEIYFSAGAKRVFTGIYAMPEINKNSFNAFKNLKVKPSYIESMAFHPMGTMRMSSSPSRGVTGKFGEVHGFKNLFVADASLFPTSLGVNPMEGIMAFSMRTGDYILNNF